MPTKDVIDREVLELEPLEAAIFGRDDNVIRAAFNVSRSNYWDPLEAWLDTPGFRRLARIYRRLTLKARRSLSFSELARLQARREIVCVLAWRKAQLSRPDGR